MKIKKYMIEDFCDWIMYYQEYFTDKQKEQFNQVIYEDYWEKCREGELIMGKKKIVVKP